MKDLVGSGTFGQVAKCFTEETNEFVAVKVIKNLPAYYTQARFEIGILHMVWHSTSVQLLLAVSWELRLKKIVVVHFFISLKELILGCQAQASLIFLMKD